MYPYMHKSQDSISLLLSKTQLNKEITVPVTFDINKTKKNQNGLMFKQSSQNVNV